MVADAGAGSIFFIRSGALRLCEQRLNEAVQNRLHTAVALRARQSAHLRQVVVFSFKQRKNKTFNKARNVLDDAQINAGKRRDVSPKAATAAVSLVGYTGLLIVPPCLGFLAAHVGLEMALLLPLTAVGIVIAGAFAFEDKKVKWRRLRA